MATPVRLKGPTQLLVPVQPPTPPANAAQRPPSPAADAANVIMADVPMEGRFIFPPERSAAPATKSHVPNMSSPVGKDDLQLRALAPLQNRAQTVSKQSLGSTLNIYKVDEDLWASGGAMPLQNKATRSNSEPSGQVRWSRQQSPGQSTHGSDVVLQVYDLHRYTRSSGLFHLGIEVYGQEFFFSCEGIMSCRPGKHQGHAYRCSVPIGHTAMSTRQVQELLSAMSKEWTKGIYRILDNNCQTFAIAFCERLGLPSDSVPAEYRRHSEVGGRWRGTAVGNVTSSLLQRVFSSAGSVAR